MAEESAETSGASSRFKRLLNEASFFSKILQVVLCAIAIGLIVGPFNNRMQPDSNRAGLIYVALGGFIMIDTILVIGYLFGERLGKKTSLLFSIAGAVLCFVTGVVLIYDSKHVQNNYISAHQDRYRDQMLASGVFAIIASIAFAIEIYVIFAEEE